MKFSLTVLLLLLGVCAVAQESDAVVKTAIEGAQLLRDAMRDTDSFTIRRAWAMRSEKYGHAICYQYQSKNGFGGMNQAVADFAMHNKKDVAKGKYILTPDADESFEFDVRCGKHAVKHDTFVKDVTAEVKAALTKPDRPE